MREERSLFFIRCCNNALLSYFAAFCLRILFEPDGVFFDPADLMVSAFAVCATLLDRVRTGMFVTILSYIAMLFGVYVSAGRYMGIPGIMRIAACLIIMITAFADRLTDQQFIRPELSEMLLFVVIYFVSYWIRRPQIQPMAFIGEALFCILCVLNAGITNMYRSLTGFHQKAAVPYGAIKKAVGTLLAVSVAVTGACVFVSGSVTFGPALWALIKRGLYKLLRAVFSLFPEAEEAQPDPIPASDTMAGAQQMYFPEADDTNPVITAIWNILFAILGVVVITFLVWALFKAVRELIGRFMKTGRKGSIVRDYTRPGETREKLAGSLSMGSSGSPGLSLAPDARIRRMYIKLIRGLPGASNIRDWESPEELEATALEDPMKKEAGLTDQLPEDIRVLYEKARYAPRSCTADDVRRMKLAVNHVR